MTASGSSHTWAENSRENRLTSFANDPVTDPTAEAWFIRDDESGEIWSPTPGPVRRDRRAAGVVIRHSRRRHAFLARRIAASTHDLDVFVDAVDPVKFSVLTLVNTSDRPRRLSLVTYNDWVLGPPREDQGVHVVDQFRRGDGRGVRDQCLQHGVCRPRRVRRA